jgi:hypothetical protein
MGGDPSTPTRGPDPVRIEGPLTLAAASNG